VTDSIAAAAGVILRGPVARVDNAALELMAAGSRVVPDRSDLQRIRNGAGFFGRASVEDSGWRVHLIFWRGQTYITEEGDANYLSRRRDGTIYRGTRDYAEAGVTRMFNPAPDLTIAVAARMHRVERHYEYSYRISAAAALQWPFR
jgi:hypothetical protein